MQPSTNLPNDSTDRIAAGNHQADFFTKIFSFFTNREASSFFDTTANFTVTNLDDAGVGSLRKAVADANAAAEDDTISFDPGLSGVITLTSGEILINSNISIIKTGASSLSVSGTNASRVFNIAADSAVTINNLKIINGRVEGSGGGVLNAGTLTVINSTISDNTALYSNAASGEVDGGGIFNSGLLELRTSTVTNNTVQVTTLGKANGGGLANTGTLSIAESSVISNSAMGKSDSLGGGIFNFGAMSVVNSTVGNNTATTNAPSSKSLGGGLFNGSQGALTLRNSTVSFNRVSGPTTDCGGIFNTTGASVTASNTIFSDNIGTGGTTVACDFSGIVSSDGYNLVSSTAGSAGWVSLDKINQPARLTSLGNYGGPTQTYGILPNSPAIDAGSNANPPATDQRGSARIVGTRIDIGSFENNTTGTVSTIPNGAVGTSYNQSLASSTPSTLTFSILSGSLPPGLSLSPSGTLSGTPTTGGGRYNFTVSFANASGAVNYREFTIFIPFTITNLSDTGAGSLRQSIIDANANPGDDNLTFQAGLTGTLTLGSELLINSNINIIGTGTVNLIISGNNSSRIFNIAANSVVTISNLTVQQGKANSSGAGILNAGTLSLMNVVVTDNAAVYSGTGSGTASGGGIYNSGTLTLLNSTVKNNSAQIINLGTSSGGGIFNTGTVTLTNSTVSGNTSSGKPGASGGGISNSGTFNISNSTVGVNTVLTSSAGSGSPTAQGGGIWNGAPGVLTVRNTTVAFNNVNGQTAAGGGIFNTTGGSVTIGNTIVSDDTTVSGSGTVVADVAGAVISEGRNLISNSTGSTGWISGDKLNQPALLTPLGNYGGPTQTFGILPDSQALNAGNNANAPATDQRGATRIIGGTIDIGSFENNVSGVLTALPNASIGGGYNQNLATVDPSNLTFALVDGALPTGLTLTSSGLISGTATTGGTFNFTVSVRDANGFVGYKLYSIVVTCTFALDQTSQTISSAGGAGTVQVIANAGCSYTIFTNNANFITITTSSVGNGNTTVGFNIAANTGPARTGSITIANLTYTIMQAAGCTYTLSASTQNFGTNGGNGEFQHHNDHRVFVDGSVRRFVDQHFNADRQRQRSGQLYRPAEHRTFENRNHYCRRADIRRHPSDRLFLYTDSGQYGFRCSRRNRQFYRQHAK